MITLKLPQKEAQSIISACGNMADDLTDLKKDNKISVGWSILYNDLLSGLEKSKDQYYKQIKAGN